MPTQVVQLSTLNGANGFEIAGLSRSSQFGRSVASAGDVNGDGLDDLIISSPSTGLTHVVFGRPGPFPAQFDLATIDGQTGFRIHGEGGDSTGLSVSAAGDLNGDGVDDLIVGDPHDSSGGFWSGAAYVVFGNSDGFPVNLLLWELDGTNGFKVSPSAYRGYGGTSVSSAGDINGDGIDDLVVGSPGSTANSIRDGATFVVFGKTTPFDPYIALSALDGTTGFRLEGAPTDRNTGIAVAAAGDINGDGIGDLIVGSKSQQAGAVSSYVVFGKTTGFAPVISLGAVDGTNGFRMVGGPGYGATGAAVSSAGDINGDGFDDLVVGNLFAWDPGYSTGTAHVVFGKAGGFDATVNLAELDGTDGFKLRSFVFGQLGTSVASAGDLNGDGIDDLLVGAARTNGDSGATYVVYGRTSFAAAIDVGNLAPGEGFVIAGEGRGASGTSVSAAGDLNHDGLADLIVGAPSANDGFGGAYVVYGRFSLTAPAGGGTLVGRASSDTLTGSASRDVLNGLGGDDALIGGGGADTLNGGDGADDLDGGAGADVLNGDAGDDRLNGGEGADKLGGGAGADTLDGGLGADRFDGGDGADYLDGGEGNDYLDGGAGGDAMAGGLGNDVYLVDDALDTTFEAAGQGYDIVRTALAYYPLADNIEALELQGALNLNGHGNGGANNLQGNSGSNGLFGEGGVDTLNGNDGDDFIMGGTGNDLLRGGLGADRFAVFGDSVGRASLETDQVLDFSAAEGDIIDLFQIDAIAGGSDDAFTLVAAFSKAAGQMTLTVAGGITTLRLDTTGDGRVDYQMKINGDVTGESGDWLL